MSEWMPLIRETGALAIVALMVWKVSASLDRVTRVLYRIEGHLLEERDDRRDTPPTGRWKHERPG